MSWIKTVPPEQAEGRLKSVYKQVSGPQGEIDNILKLHSLRPHTLIGHMALYKNVLHHTSNQVPKWFLELLGVYTSLLNGCAYCVEHHFSGLRRLLDDDQRAHQLRIRLEMDQLSEFEHKQELALNYTRDLTRNPSKLTQDHVKSMQEAGWNDGEILEINQVVSYFAYANRTVLGLGCSLTGDKLGLSPSSNDQDNWSHN